ncbi:MAG: class I SAM-dependent methyltransferase [Candidatus Diapherotrites archaeon]|uniref:Class I SAM-dependent methyltransferase n=1 Tax=Candidatus Iainarchaeum sp. TaxID=3101447 RepID=A0A8T4C6W9_9ARCH|nr:class I SAM-dependent methyltransferase [Candidatus Diapherotrites archaeon]
MPSRPAPKPVEKGKDSVYWDYWEEMVKASIWRESKELPAIAAVAEIQGKHVIDAGCGPGRLILPFSKIAKTITAVDESDWVIKVVSKMIREKRLNNVQIAQAPLVGLPFDDGVSDSTYCMWVIHHDKSRWDKIVKELVRVTRDGSPITVGFSSGEGDLPRLEEVCKPAHVQKCKEFDVAFPKWCKEQEWSVEITKVPLLFEFKSPEWAFEVFSNTFVRRDITNEQKSQLMQFLKQHVKNGKCVITQELRLYVIRETE